MKKTLGIFMLMLAAYWAKGQDKGIHFEQGLSWQQVLIKAKTENKYIFVDAYTTWCGPCRMMSQTIFPMKEVGDYMNAHFINVRFQLDTTKNDDDTIRTSYKDAHDLMWAYKISSFPTYLFFSPDGRIVHRSGDASNDPNAFLDKAHDALDPNKQYYTLLDRYNSGNRDSAMMRNLALATFKFGDKTKSRKIGKEFIKNLHNVYTKDNLEFIGKISTDSKSIGFNLWLHHSKEVNAAMSLDYAERKVMNMIMAEDSNVQRANRKAVEGLKFLFMMGNQPIYGQPKPGTTLKQPVPPEWKKMYVGIERKYGLYYADRITSWIKISYYSQRQLWNEYYLAVVTYIQKHQKTLNNKQLDQFAYDIFSHSQDKSQLKAALSWSKLTLNNKDDNFYGYLDTYAKLLYKLNDKAEAITQEERVIAIAPFEQKWYYKFALKGMKKGENANDLTPKDANPPTENITDGPYIFYRNGWVVTKSIEVNNAIAKVVMDSIPENQKSKKLIKVELQDHPEWGFTVQLKAKNDPRTPVFAKPDKILVLSDIEGEFEHFRNLLLTAKVIDEKYNWTFGKGRLVVAGDLFDRGDQVCQFLWLLYKLEDEARQAGGDVNVILGNHDIMNLEGDVRYVGREYFVNAKLISEDYSRFYDANSELGRWLRSKNTIEKIGDLLVLHGGVSPELLQKHLDLTTLNDRSRPYYAAAWQTIPDSLQFLFGDKTALFWYRGYFVEPKATQGLVDSTLAFYDCKRIIVGHDIIDHIAPFYNNKVIGVDVNEHLFTHEGLLIENNKYYRIDDKGNKTLILN